MSTLSQFTGGNGPGAAITGYTQTSVYQTSQSIAIPAGTKRIEALLCGGGSAGGFGGLQVYEIPVVGSTLSFTVGAGTNLPNGYETAVSINGFRYAVVGQNYASSGDSGLAPYNTKNLICSVLDTLPRVGTPIGSSVSNGSAVWTAIIGANVQGASNAGIDATAGWGGSRGSSSVGVGYPGGVGASGGDANGDSFGGAGGAGGGGGFGGGGFGRSYAGGDGGSMTDATIWGLTGFAGGSGTPSFTSTFNGGGGGGGMLSAGSNGSGITGGNGGNGGGGAGRGFPNGTGGNGFAVFRWYY